MIPKSAWRQFGSVKTEIVVTSQVVGMTIRGATRDDKVGFTTTLCTWCLINGMSGIGNKAWISEDNGGYTNDIKLLHSKTNMESVQMMENNWWL